jgi:hypothetical protein
MTTHPVVTIEQALQVIQWYCWRWLIEKTQPQNHHTSVSFLRVA